MSRDAQLFDLIIIFGLLSPVFLIFIFILSWHITKMDRERPPSVPITVECMSSTGETFHTDIGISFEEVGHMRYHIVEYNGERTNFNGFCSSDQVKNDS